MNLQPAAIDKLKELVAEEGNPNLMLRVFVQGGGCSGLSYELDFDDSIIEGDSISEDNGIKVVVDKKSLLYLSFYPLLVHLAPPESQSCFFDAICTKNFIPFNQSLWSFHSLLIKRVTWAEADP